MDNVFHASGHRSKSRPLTNSWFVYVNQLAAAMLAELAFGENLRDQLIEKLHDVKNNITLEVAIDKVRN